ncbi:MAG: late competence development ComFB family protein [Clostridiales bacterium]|nr:late competence development ComFB family protein [Clostridiales bacterium]
METDYHLRNVSEDLIEMHLDDCIRKSEMCDCARCRIDVKAFALNAFPAHYVVTDFGDALTRTHALSVQFKVDVITAIMKGVVLVKKNPRHE